jgi:hypothetical protein
VKLKALIGAVVVGALGAAVAFAAPPPGNPGNGHKTTTTSTSTTTSTTTVTTVSVAASTGVTTHGRAGTHGNTGPHGNRPACVPQVMVIVKGTANDVGGTDSLSLNVNGGNHFAKLLFQNDTTTNVTLKKGTNTSITNLSGNATALTSVQKGDRVLAQYKVCKSSLSGKNATLTTNTAFTNFLTANTARKIVDLGQPKS